MNLIDVPLANLHDAPWRFTEDPAAGQVKTRKYTNIQANIAASLLQHGQLAPIHVRPGKFSPDAGTPCYEIVHGHIVAAAARQIGLTAVHAVVLNATDAQAFDLYVHFNLNRGEFFHVRLMRMLKAFYPTNDQAERDAAVAKLRLLSTWDEETLDAYLALSERDKNWREFMYAADDASEEQTGFFEAEDIQQPVPDSQ